MRSQSTLGSTGAGGGVSAADGLNVSGSSSLTSAGMGSVSGSAGHKDRDNGLAYRYLCQVLSAKNDSSTLLPTSCLWDLRPHTRPPLTHSVLGALRGNAKPILPRSLSDSTRSIGSIRLVFALLNSAETAVQVVSALKMLRVLLHRNISNREEMTTMKGYELLAHYLKTHSALISPKVVCQIVYLALPMDAPDHLSHGHTASQQSPSRDAKTAQANSARSEIYELLGEENEALIPLSEQTPNPEAISHIVRIICIRKTPEIFVLLAQE